MNDVRNYSIAKAILAYVTLIVGMILLGVLYVWLFNPHLSFLSAIYASINMYGEIILYFGFLWAVLSVLDKHGRRLIMVLAWAGLVFALLFLILYYSRNIR